ncbi:MAG: FkbM family methyltransferase [Bacteroidetes bacterium]|nr:FkbM family methyltransferase [Bacteroidota bacterium]
MRREAGAFLRAIRNKIAGKSDRYPYVEEFSLEHAHFKYWITDELYREWYNPEAHRNWAETQAYLNFVNRNDRVLEVGCNNGFTTCLLKSLTGQDGLVVGLDIIPENVMISQAQIALNRFANCYVLNLGADDKRKKIKVQNTNNGFVVLKNSIGSIEVDVVPCDALISEFGFFDIIKIDVEGYEGNVLRGCRELLSKNPKLMIELHGDEIVKYNSSINEIYDMIGVDRYEGIYCLRADPKLRTFDKNQFNPRAHATLFLKPKLH